ncbi:uncharacterized protein LOC135703145 [Ochlerotatus camptorhynchus]|uniref:uncharacterized protein LOC135703145 n=1 Tax=Ochlerotatus camptorhynchus TaxID=644619 RepID=UPI0031E1757E
MSIEFYETELHRTVRQALSNGGNQSIIDTVIDRIRSDRDDCLFQNSDGLTPSELALSLNPEGPLFVEMIRTECEDLSTVEGFRRILVRGNLRLVQTFSEIIESRYGWKEMQLGLTQAFAELRTRNVCMSPEIDDWAQYLLVEADYQRCSSAEDNRMALEKEREGRLRHLLECIEFLEAHHCGGCSFDDIDERFLLYVRQILEHVFFLKNWLKDLPLMQLQFCLVVFLRTVTGSRNEKVDIFGFMIDKEAVINFLGSFRKVFIEYWDVKRLTAQAMFEGLKTHTTGPGQSKIFTSVRQKIANHSALQRLRSFEKFEQLDPAQITELDEICDTFRKRWITSTHRKHFKSLLKTYYTAKQFYSVGKVISSIQTIQNLTLVDPSSLPTSIAALKRALQSIGEAIKSSKQTPNITKKLDTILCMFPAQSFVALAKELRQFFSHDYSLAKDRLDRDCPLELFRSTLGTLKASLRWLSYVSFLQNTHVFRQYLGRLLRMQSLDQMRSYVKFIGMEFKSQLISRFEPSDSNDAVVLVEHLIERSHDGDEKLELGKVLHVLTIYRNSIRNDVATIGHTIDQFFFLEMYIQQDAAAIERVRTLLRCMLQETARAQRYASVDKASTMVSADAIARLIIRETDQQKKILLEELWKRLVRQNTTAIESLKHQTVVPADQCLEETISTLSDLGVAIGDEEFVRMVNNRLKKKYYQNLFDLNNKYHVLNEVIKDRRVGTGLKQLKTRLKELRLLDEGRFQQKFDSIIDSIRKIIVKHGRPEELISIQLTPDDRFALEYHLLEACEILCSLGIFKDNLHSLKGLIPVITGRNLRNYLAHDRLAYEVLTGTSSAIEYSALYLIRHPIKLYHKSTIPTKITDDKFDHFFNHKLKWINIQQEYFTAAESFDIESLRRLARVDNIHIFERNQLDNDLLTIALNGQPRTFIEHLRNSSFELNLFLLLLSLPIDCKLRRMIRQLLNDPHMFCFTVSIRFELIEQLQSNPNAKRSLHKQEVERILRSYSIASIQKVTEFLSIEQFLVDSRFRNTILHWMVLRGDLEAVRFFLARRRTMINNVNVFGETPLALAVRYGYSDIVRLLLENGAHVNVTKWNPLWIASKLGNLELLPYLIDENTDRCPERNNPLVGSLQSIDLEIFVKLHEEYGFGYQVQNLLHKAIQLDRPRFVQYILASEAGRELVHSLDELQFTPLMTAATCGRSKLFSDLLRSGANPSFANENGFTALHCAVYSGKRVIIDVLLKNPHVDINAIADDRFTALSIAIGQHNVRQVNYLLSKGAEVKSFQILLAGYYKAYDIVRILLDRNGALLNEARDVHNRTLLMYAIIDGDLFTVDYLIAKGADLGARSRGGFTALHTAVGRNALEICDHLIEANCDMEITDEFNRTALVIAVEQEFTALAIYLLVRGANPETVRSFRFDLFKASFLHKFTYENRFFMVHFLLDRFSFDCSLLDDRGRTALDLAREQGNDAIAALLSDAAER